MIKDMRLLLVLAFVLGACTAGAGELNGDWAYAEKKLAKAGFDRGFIAALGKSYEAKEFKNVLELNVLLFMKKSDYHGVQVTDDAVTTVGAFVTENQEALAQAQRDYGLPGPIIASLMFIESRYGSNLGNFHVPSVYVHMLQGERPEVLKHLRTEGYKRFTDKPLKKDLAKVPERVKTKAKWALDELRAVQKIYKQRGAKFALALRGSFSGAFGMPQFLPSSYARWARSAKPGAPPDLVQPADAIQSVANYLKQNGWRQKRPKSHMKALLNYNNSRDYANAILTLAQQVEGKTLADAKN